MNKSYFLVPIVLLAVFAFLYRGATKEMEIKQATQQAELDKKKAEEKKHKEEIDARAAADAKKHQEIREAEDKAKADKKEAEYQKVLKDLKDETVKYSTEADKLSKEAADLEIQISQARTDKEKLNRDTFDLAKQVEQEKINRRNAELEIQRMMEMVATKLASNSIIIPPPPPLPAPTKQ
jgi:hypothetical protein